MKSIKSIIFVLFSLIFILVSVNKIESVTTVSCEEGSVLISGSCVPVTVSVTASPLVYNQAPSADPYLRDLKFSYTSNTNGGLVECTLLDYTKSALTQQYKKDNPLLWYSPDAVGSFSYYLRCRSTAYPALTVDSEKITVNLACSPDQHFVNNKCVTFPKITATATPSSYGSISPSGTVNADYGKLETYGPFVYYKDYKIHAKRGYYISSFKVNGVSQEILINSDIEYSFKDIKSNQTIEAVFAPSVPYTKTSDLTPRIAFWPGKVNQYIDASGYWKTDPDYTSGSESSQVYSGDYGDKVLDYCKKWYPDSKRVDNYQNENIEGWRDRGGAGNYSRDILSFRCVEFITSGDISSSDCIIPAGSSSCDVDLSWSTLSPITNVTSAVTTPSNIIIKSANNGSATYKVSYGSRSFFLYHNAVELDSSTSKASCVSGSSWNGSICASEEINPISSLSGSNCFIKEGESSCLTTLLLNISNPVNGASTNITKASNIEVANGLIPASKPNISVNYPNTKFWLNHNQKTLAETTIYASCESGTFWSNSNGQCMKLSCPDGGIYPNCISNVDNTDTNPEAGSCGDGIKNGTETDIDCGGTCPSCKNIPIFKEI